MLERIKCCLCYPRFIGKFFKDKFSTIFMTILLFFGVYVLSMGFSIYSSDYFDDNSVLAVTSTIVQGEKSNISYDSTNAILSGDSITYEGNGFNVVFFPVETEEVIDYTNLEYYANINIVFDSQGGYIDLGGIIVSRFEYKDININDFSINDVQDNDTEAVYTFKVLVKAALKSSNVFFNTYEFFINVFSDLAMYFIFVLISYFFSKSVNSGIESKIRAKLCFYDNLIYFIVSMVVCLTGVEWLSFIGVLLPLIYTYVTFRHIVRVNVKN